MIRKVEWRQISLKYWNQESLVITVWCLFLRTLPHEYLFPWAVRKRSSGWLWILSCRSSRLRFRPGGWRYLRCLPKKGSRLQPGRWWSSAPWETILWRTSDSYLNRIGWKSYQWGRECLRFWIYGLVYYLWGQTTSNAWIEVLIGLPCWIL